MSTLILLEHTDIPKNCSTCPFFNSDICCCEILSRATNKTITVNKYLEERDKRCPLYEVDEEHGRILDEKDIRTFFSSFPFTSREIRFSMMDIFSNLDSILEIAPKHERNINKLKARFNTCGEALKELLMSPREIEGLINQVNANKEDSDGREDNQV